MEVNDSRSRSPLSLLPPPLASLLTRLHLNNPLNVILLAIVLYLAHTLFIPGPPKPLKLPLPTSPGRAYNWRPDSHSASESIQLWRTFTPEELRPYDGTSTDDGRQGKILMAIRRKVYDVSSGASFYGPGGPYATFAGRDASRGLAKQSFESEMLTPVDEPIDRLEDLTRAEWDNLKDWEGEPSRAGHEGGLLLVIWTQA